MKILLYILVALVGFVLFAFLFEYFIKFQQRRRWAKKDLMVLKVKVSKLNETGPIVAEQVFATMHGIYGRIGLWKRFLGYTNDQISFEIASVNRKIAFYIVFPKKLKNLIEGQIYAQYPDVEISEEEDYSAKRFVEMAHHYDENVHPVTGNTLTKTGEIVKAKKKEFERVDMFQHAMGAELTLADPDVYPIKRFPQFEDKLTRVAVDPMAAITATFSQFNDPDEQAWLQIVARPLDDKWRIVFTKCVRLINKGLFLNIEKLQKAYARAFCTRKIWPRVLFFPLYIFFFFQGVGVGAKAMRITADGVRSAGGDDYLDEETSKNHDRETATSAAMDKVVKLLFEVGVRIVVIPKDSDKESAMVKLKEIAGSFGQFSLPHLNRFDIDSVTYNASIVDKFQKRLIGESSVLNTEELATIYHMPHMTVQTPNIEWVKSRKLEPPGDLPTHKKYKPEELTVMGRTNFRGQRVPFGIKGIDRRRHIYIIGKTGMGKSTMLENMIFSDIMNGKGVGVVDPHGDLAEAVIDFVPPNRTNDVIIFDPADRDFPVSFNMLENADPNFNSIICSGLVGIFKKIYADSWGPRLEHILRNTILALLEYPNTTMLGIVRILQDGAFRKKVVGKVTDPVVKAFWTQEFAAMTDKFRTEAISPILNKVGQFLSSPIVRNIVGQPKSAVDLRFAMDKGKIVIVNLSKGRIGEDNSSLLGAMMITKFQLDAMSRADIAEADRKDFYLYVDEFQNFATDSFATILSEARKYRLNLTMANQYIAQMPDEVRDAVFGNVGTLLSFQVGFDDAEYLSGQYAEEVLPNDVVSLSKYTAYMRLLIDGMPSKTFSLDSLEPPRFEVEDGRREKVIQVSRERYSKPRKMVEDKINRWSGTMELDEGKKELDIPKGKSENVKKSEPKREAKTQQTPKSKDAKSGK